MLRSYHPLQPSPTGWYLASYLLVTNLAHLDLHDTNADSPLEIWENRVLVTAESPRVALEKIDKIGSSHEREFTNGDGERLRTHYYGIISITPIQNAIQDECEIEWIDRTGMTIDQLDPYVAGYNAATAFNLFDGIQEDDEREFPPSIPHYPA